MTDPLIIDSFAGGFGASTWIKKALGRGPDVAIAQRRIFRAKEIYGSEWDEQ